ncbi:hypothetical protein SAMN05428985_102194 [Nocardioides sp. YR527]|nr:hypothetical protein SAMN05428985_102194 [Nocardioides sp. YR527]
MVVLYPWAGLMQGAEPWIRRLSAAPRTNATRRWLLENLEEWDNAAADLRQSNYRALYGGRAAMARHDN